MIYFRDSIYSSNLHWKNKTKENLLAKSCVSLLTCYWNNSGFKNILRLESCYCSSLSLGRSAQTKCIQSSQAKALEILYVLSPCFTSRAITQAPAHTFLFVPCSFLSSKNFIQSHFSSLFRAQEEGTTLPRASNSLLQEAIPLFKKLYALLQLFSCISSLVLSPEWSPNMRALTCWILGNQEPEAGKNRIFWTRRLNLPSHTTIPTNIPTKENKQWCSLKQELFRSFLAL